MLSPVHQIVIKEWLPESYTVEYNGRTVQASDSEELAYVLQPLLPCISKLTAEITELEDELAKSEAALDAVHSISK